MKTTKYLSLNSVINPSTTFSKKAYKRLAINNPKFIKVVQHLFFSL